MRVPALQASIRALVVVLGLLRARHEVEEVAPPPSSASRGARGRRLGRGLDLQARRRGARGRRWRGPVQRHELPSGEELVGGRERRRRRGHDVELELVAVGLSRRRQGRGAVKREGIRRGRGHRCGSHCRGRRGMNARGGAARGSFKLARGAVGLVQRRRRPVASQRGVVSSTVSRKVPKIYERFRAVGSMAPPRRGIHTREERVYEATGVAANQTRPGAISR